MRIRTVIKYAYKSILWVVGISAVLWAAGCAPMEYEWKLECDNGFSTGWVDHVFYETNSVRYRMDGGLNTSYHIPEGVTCTSDRRQ